MKTLTVTIVLFASLTAAAQTQSLREKAQMDPLDCALYLNSIGELNSYDTSLVMSLYRLGRYDDIITSAPKSIGFKEFARFGLERLKADDKVTAEKFAAAAKRSFEKDGDWWRASDFAGYIELLIALDRIDEPYKIAEKQDDLEDRSALLLQIAESAVKFNKTGVAKIAVERIPPDFFFSDARDLIRQSDVFASLGDRDSQLRLLNRAELDISSKANSDSPDRLRLELIRRYLSLSDPAHSRSLWDSVDDKGEPYNRLLYIKALLRFGQRTAALKMLDEIDPKNFGNYSNGTDVVRLYVDQKLTDKALKYAIAISENDDNYDQQSAFMALVDHHLASKNLKDAERVLDLANSRASQIAYETSAAASTSPGIRKAKFLEAISQRYAKLGKFDRGINALRTLDVGGSSAKTSFASLIAKFAMENAKSLSISRVTDLLKQAAQIAAQIDDDSTTVDVAVSTAEALSQLGQRSKAVDVISELLEKYADEYQEKDALILSGEVFEKYKLNANDRLQRALSSIISNHEN